MNNRTDRQYFMLFLAFTGILFLANFLVSFWSTIQVQQMPYIRAGIIDINSAKNAIGVLLLSGFGSLILGVFYAIFQKRYLLNIYNKIESEKFKVIAAISVLVFIIYDFYSSVSPFWEAHNLILATGRSIFSFVTLQS